jgi:subtilisin family serine protease
VFIIDSGLEKLDQVTHGSLVMALVMRHYLNIRTVDLDEGVSKFSAKRLLKALQWILGYRKEYPRSTVIVNLSWGSIDPDPLVTAAIGSLVSSGVVVVAAAGNDGKPQCAYPAGLPGVIAVASVVKAPRGSFSIAPYSNRGSCISAAGVQDSAAFLRDIRRSAIIPADSLFKSSYLEQEEQLSKLAASVGTSFAAPIVTGALAAHIERTHEFDREHFFMGKTAHVEGLGAVPVFQ